MPPSEGHAPWRQQATEIHRYKSGVNTPRYKTTSYKDTQCFWWDPRVKQLYLFVPLLKSIRKLPKPESQDAKLKKRQKHIKPLFNIIGYSRQDDTNWNSMSSKMKTQGTSVFKRWGVLTASYLFDYLSDPSLIIAQSYQVLTNLLNGVFGDLAEELF